MKKYKPTKSTKNRRRSRTADLTAHLCKTASKNKLTLVAVLLSAVTSQQEGSGFTS